ncbi:MAG TPA: isocitrate lyase/phosphoenolpyruvate mutase family protein [Streptosporangiaceae bacterium]
MPVLADKARQFRALHEAGRPLLLPNAWDVASARVIADAGAAAIATTSAGVAWSLGFGDGGHLDRQRALQVIARIAAAVEVPVTADIEGGFADEPEGVAETIAGVLEAGAVGVNLEDSLRPVARQAERIAAARGAADAVGVPLFLNARIDTHRLPGPDGAMWLDETLTRAAAYVDAGADGVFVLGALDAASITALADAVPVPVNVLIGPGTLPVPALAKAGAARISAGSSIAEAAYGLAARAARELLADGTAQALAGGLDYATLNTLILRPAP